MRENAILIAGLALIFAMVGLLIADLSIYGLHPLDVVAIALILFLGTVVGGSLLRRP